MTLPRKVKGYGWLPDLPDQRDRRYAAPASVRGDLPARVDLRPGCPPVYDQGELGSCTAQAIAGAIEFDRLRQGVVEFTPSRLFIYYNERVIEDSVAIDGGAMPRDGIKVVASLGAPPEDDWPYDIDRFDVRPPARAFRDALPHRVAGYERLPRDLDHMRGCLASGFPFILGFAVYESFEGRGGAPHRAHADAEGGGAGDRRPRRARRGLRRPRSPVHRAQLLGPGLRHGRLFHDALPVPATAAAVS